MTTPNPQSPIASPTRPSRIEGKDCLTAGCHAELAKPKYVHEPTVPGKCRRCHEETDGRNHKYRMVAEPPALCFGCHAAVEAKLRDKGTYPYHHPSVDQGKCLDCHNPHASGHPMLLRKESEVELCMSCHRKSMPLSGNVHDPIGMDGCMVCHTGHASEHGGLLRQPVEDLCVECHDDTYEEAVDLAHVHSPVEAKNCTGCHTPHASPRGKLLIAPFSEDLYVPYDEQEKYGLCFECHDSEMLDEDRTEEDTGFRNGDLNLHFLHVNKESKGRSCRICHLAHGSDQPRLIRPEVPFGEWELRIRYIPTETGGYCGPGCHPAKRYDRAVAVDLNQKPAVPDAHQEKP